MLRRIESAGKGLLPMALFALFGSVSAGAADPIFETVAPGVVAVLQPPGYEIQDANSVVVQTASGLVVVDAPSTREFVEATLAHIDGLEAGRVRFLVNTHWHTDHVQSNELYRERYGDDLLIVGHRTLTHDIPERTSAMIHEERERLGEVIPRAEAQLGAGLTLGGDPLDEEGRARQRAAIDAAKEKHAAFGELELLPPDLTYEHELTLRLGGVELRLLHFGAHTDGDTVVYLPQQRVLLTGDLLDVMPYAGHGDPRAWVKTLETLGELDFDRIVPGHGPVFEGKGQLRTLRDYFATIVEGVDRALAEGRSVEQAKETIDLAPFREKLAGESATLQRNFDRFAPETVERAYALQSVESRASSPD